MGFSWKKFIPLFGLAALLPLMVVFVLKPPELGFSSQASQENELRIWLEPKTVVANPNQVVKFRVVSSYGDESDFITSVSMKITSDDAVVVTNPLISYSKPFTGRVALGEVSVVARSQGSFNIEIPKDEVSVSSEKITILTSPANLIVE